MYARNALCLLFCLVVSPLAVAGAPSFSSPEAIKDQIDAAMPGLVKRDEAAVETLLEGLLPAEKAEALIPAVRGQLKLDADFQPLEAGWLYRGTRKLGSMYRQLVYVCRYDRGVTVWRFTIVEKDKRWLVDGLNCNGNAEDLLEDTQTPDKQCLQVSEEIAGMIANGDKNLADVAKDWFVSCDPVRTPQIEGVARKLTALSMTGGGLVKWERLRSRETEGILAENQYLVQWKDGTIIVKLSFYHAADEWKLTAIHSVQLDESVMKQSAWESSSQLAAKPSTGALR